MTSPDVCVAENCQAPFMNDTSQGLGANAPGDARTRTGAELLGANAPVQLYSLLLATAISGGGMPPSPPGSAPAGLAGLWYKLEGLVHEARCCLVADYDTGEDPAPPPPPPPTGHSAGEDSAPPPPPPPPQPQPPPAAPQPGRTYAAAVAATLAILLPKIQRRCTRAARSVHSFRP